MAKPLELPTSGPVLSTLVDAFDLRQWDPKKNLSSRNASRFFKGERVSASASALVFRAVASALFQAKILPPLAIIRALFPPDDPRVHRLSAGTQHDIIARLLATSASQWDALVGALRTKTAPLDFELLARGACLRLLVIDLSTRLCALLWLTRWHGQDPLPLFWTEEGGTSRWLRGLIGRCSPPLTREVLAEEMNVHLRSVDGWLDSDVRPGNKHLEAIARRLASRQTITPDDLLRQLRLAYGMRHLFRVVEGLIGPWQARESAARLVQYPLLMLMEPRNSRHSRPLLDHTMGLLLVSGTVRLRSKNHPSVAVLLESLRRQEPDPVWRTTLRAATGSWFHFLQGVATRLLSSPEERWHQAGITRPPPDERERIAYLAQATEEELEHSPGHALVSSILIADGGRPAAMEWKIRAREAAQRGDRLSAIDALRHAIAQEPLDAELHFFLGAELWQLGGTETTAEGLCELELAVVLAPDWDRPRAEIGVVLLNTRPPLEAVDHLEASRTALSVPSPWLLFLLGVAQERAGHPEAALRTFEEVLTHEPRNAEALDRAAHLHFVAGDPRQGARRAKEASHLGVSTIFRAWEDGHYQGRGPWARPDTVPEAPLHVSGLPDNG